MLTAIEVSLQKDRHTHFPQNDQSTESTVNCTLPFIVAFKLGLIAAFPLRENMDWAHSLGLRFRPFFPDHSETHLRALLTIKKAFGIPTEVANDGKDRKYEG